MFEKTKLILLAGTIRLHGVPSIKNFHSKFMKEIKPDYYSSKSEMVAEWNEKIPAEAKTINLVSDGFDIHFDYDSFSIKSFVTMSYGVSTKMEESNLLMRLEFKENDILCGSSPILSPFMANMERYTALYV